MEIMNLEDCDLDTLSHIDVAHYILTKEEKGMKVLDLLSNVCDILEIDKDEMDEILSDFFASLMSDKRFTLLDNGLFDLRERHIRKKYEDDELSDDEFEFEDDETDTADSDLSEKAFHDDEDEMEDYKNLVIVSDDELENEE